MTDLHASTASLVFPPELSGRLFVRDGNGALVAEVHKLAAQPIELGLPPGHYRVTLGRSAPPVGDGHRSAGGPADDAVAPAAGRAGAGHHRVTRPGHLRRARVGGQPDAPRARGQPLRLPGLRHQCRRPSRNRFVFGFVARSASLDGFSLSLVHLTDQDTRGAQLGYLGGSSGGDLPGRAESPDWAPSRAAGSSGCSSPGCSP